MGLEKRLRIKTVQALWAPTSLLDSLHHEGIPWCSSRFNTLWPQFRLLSIRAQGHPLEQLPVPIGIAAGALPAQAGLRITSAWPSQHSCWLLLLFEGFQFCNVPLQIVLICLFGNFIMGGDFSFFFFLFCELELLCSSIQSSNADFQARVSFDR